jgi:uncharacterized protein (DUF2344 family)
MRLKSAKMSRSLIRCRIAITISREKSITGKRSIVRLKTKLDSSRIISSRTTKRKKSSAI